MMEKKCNKCGTVYSGDLSKYFHKHSKLKDGYRNDCKMCRRTTNKPIVKEGHRICSKCKNELPLNEEYFMKDSTKKNGLSNICKQCDKEKGKKYRKENKDKLKETKKKYMQTQKGKQALKNGMLKRRERITIGVLKTRKPITHEQWEDCLKYFNESCAYCGTHQNNLEWTLEQEHIIPLSKGGTYDVSNIIPACRTCNVSKKDRKLETWFKSKEYYSDEKLNKIKEYIEKVL